MYHTIIMGAGFSGLCLASQLLKKGFKNILILEKESSIGGTWFNNNYPGAECDIESHLYSYSFFPNPNWSNVYSKREEIYEYLSSFCKHFKLYPKIRFNSKIIKAKYYASTKSWIIQTDKEMLETQFFVYSYSPLHYPIIPENIKKFKGPIIHTANWDKSVSLENKNVAIIGNAASGIQVIPYLAEKASHLFIFQRTPNWVLSKWNRKYTDLEKWLFQFPWIQKIYRNYIYWSREFFFIYFYQQFFVRKWMEYFIKFELRNHPYFKKIIPNYTLGCKRILLSDDYYKTLCKKNVSLLQVKNLKVSENSIEDIPIDVVILATGFDLQGSVKHTQIIGNNDTYLAKIWINDYFRTYFGIYVDNFPNMFVMLGPNTGSAHTSIIVYIEAQCKNILQAIEKVEKNDKNSIEISTKFVNNYLEWMDGRFPHFVWNNCNSWYVTNNKNVSLFPGHHFYYEWLVNNHQFKGFTLS